MISEALSVLPDSGGELLSLEFTADGKMMSPSLVGKLF